ncbi:MAG: CHAD domain-containing protein [Acidobacteria bacterium]|nr:CHAD domain-containing protein [Acidobacteriota bacterium]
MAFDYDPVAQLFQRLERQLNKLSSKPQPKNIHQFRTAARRVETVLGELHSLSDRRQRKLLKLVTKLRRRAGKVRDLDVETAALRSLRVSEQPGRKTQILETMLAMRAKHERRLLDLLDKETVRELRHRLKRAHERFPDTPHDAMALTRTMLAAFMSNGHPTSEKLLHRYRIAGKKIRYIAELAADHNDAQYTIEELKRMQDALGEWHDWLTLGQRVAKLLPESVNSPLRAAISNITRAKYRDAVQAVSTAKANLNRFPSDIQVAPPQKPNIVAQRVARAVA